jgi:hypothetical protein
MRIVKGREHLACAVVVAWGVMLAACADLGPGQQTWQAPTPTPTPFAFGDSVPWRALGGGKLVFYRTSFSLPPHLVVLDCETRTAIQCLAPSDFDREPRPVVSPNGQWVAYRREIHDDSDIWRLTTMLTDPSRLTWRAEASQPTWSPGGELYYYSSGDILRFVGPGVSIGRRIPSDVGEWIRPSVTRGRRVALASPQAVYVWAPGSAFLGLHPEIGDDEILALAWSPDGMQLALLTSSAQRASLWLMREDGSDLHRILLSPRSLVCPPCMDVSWSPWGDQLALNMPGADRNTHVYVVNADGSGRVQVTTADADDWNVSWGR